MNSNQPTTNSFSSVSAESISRRAYEIWEQQGRPDGCDLQHWLQAEQELNGGRNTTSSASFRSASAETARTDARPLQGTRASGAASRETKRSTPTPFGSEKAASNGTRQAAVGRK